MENAVCDSIVKCDSRDSNQIIESSEPLESRSLMVPSRAFAALHLKIVIYGFFIIAPV